MSGCTFLRTLLSPSEEWTDVATAREEVGMWGVGNQRAPWLLKGRNDLVVRVRLNLPRGRPLVKGELQRGRKGSREVGWGGGWVGGHWPQRDEWVKDFRSTTVNSMHPLFSI